MTGKVRKGAQGHVPRAARFNLKIPIRYRVTGQAGWDEGTTENISRSGVLFQAEPPLDLGTPVDLAFTLPVEMAGETHTEVTCRGRVVRTQPAAKADGLGSVAATILNYRFWRAREAPSRA